MVYVIKDADLSVSRSPAAVVAAADERREKLVAVSAAGSLFTTSTTTTTRDNFFWLWYGGQPSPGYRSYIHTVTAAPAVSPAFSKVVSDCTLERDGADALCSRLKAKRSKHTHTHAAHEREMERRIEPEYSARLGESHRSISHKRQCISNKIGKAARRGIVCV